MLRSLFSDPAGTLLAILYRLPAIFLALSCHEWGHAFVANALGDPTAKNMGRMTINPAKHIDPIGFISMMLFGFGWAKPVPVNPRNFKNARRDDTLVSVAGVIVNFIAANIAMIVWYVVMAVFGVTHPVILGFMNALISVNIGLMVFNLLPVPPLDGYHILKNALIRRVKPTFFWTYERYGNYILMALVLFGFASDFIGTVMGWVLTGMLSFYTAIFGLFL